MRDLIGAFLLAIGLVLIARSEEMYDHPRLGLRYLMIGSGMVGSGMSVLLLR